MIGECEKRRRQNRGAPVCIQSGRRLLGDLTVLSRVAFFNRMDPTVSPAAMLLPLAVRLSRSPQAEHVTNPADQLNASLAGSYVIERELGQGGMATVYLAQDIKHKRKVALKVLKPELGAVLGVERFLSEIQVTANLQHPNLLPLFDSGESEGLLFYV